MIIFLYGEDTFRSQKKLKELEEKFLREVDPSGNSIDKLEGEKLSLPRLQESLSSSSLFVQKRLIIIRNIFANKSESIFSSLADYLKSFSSDNIIIFWDNISGTSLSKNKIKLFNFLKNSDPKKMHFAQEFKPLSGTQIVNWIRQEVQNRGGSISYQAANTLVSFVGNDLWRISNELDKLLHYKQSQEGKSSLIEVEDVKQMVHGQIDENIFSLTDALGSKNKARAIELLEEQIEAGINEIYLLSMIIRQFKILLQVKEAVEAGLSSRKIINLLGLHPFIVQKSLTQSRYFSCELLKKILIYLIEADKKIKSSRVDLRDILGVMIAKI